MYKTLEEKSVAFNRKTVDSIKDLNTLVSRIRGNVS